MIIWGFIPTAFATIFQYQLDNGLQVVLEKTTHIPQVSMELRYHFDPSEVTGGTAHLVEHLLFERILLSGFSENGAYDRWVQENHGSTNAKTHWAHISIETTIASNKIEDLLHWEATRMDTFCEALQEDDIENQKMIIAQEMINQELRAFGDMADTIRKNVFASDPILGAEVMGTIPDLEAIDKEQLCLFANNNMVPNQTTIALVGDVDPDQIRHIINREFGESPQKNREITKKNVPFTSYQAKRFFVHDSRKRHLYFVWPAAKYGTKEEIWGELILKELIDPYTGVLQYYYSAVSGWSENTADGGWIVIEIETDKPQQTIQEMQIFFSQYEQWIGEKDLWLFAKQNAAIMAQLQLQNKERVRLLSKCQTVQMSHNCYQWEVERRSNLNIKDIAPALQAQFDLSKASIVWVGSENKIEGEP